MASVSKKINQKNPKRSHVGIFLIFLAIALFFIAPSQHGSADADGLGLLIVGGFLIFIGVLFAGTETLYFIFKTKHGGPTKEKSAIEKAIQYFILIMAIIILIAVIYLPRAQWGPPPPVHQAGCYDKGHTLVCRK